MSLAGFLAPRSVAVVGASSDPDRIGGRPIRYLRAAGFSGPIYPVNPHREEIQGLRCFPAMSALPAPPDLAVIAVPRQRVQAALEECVAVGASHLAIFSSGFAEAGEEGRRLQEAVAASLRGAGTRVLGPNCNGVIVPALRAPISFSPVLDRGFPRVGDIAIVVQSAAIGTYLLDRARERGLGVRYWVHTGNEMDVTLEEIVEAAVQDPGVSTILLSFEVLRAPGRLMSAVKAARARGVAIVALQVATSEPGRRAALSHTGALVSDQMKVAYALLKQRGVHVASSMREMLDVALAHRVRSAAASGRAGILTTSGGLGIMLVDALAGAGLTVPTLSSSLQGHLRAVAPYCLAGNPVDSTAQVVNDPSAFRGLLETLVGSPEFDLLIVFLATAGLSDALTQQVLEVARRSADHAGPRLLVVGATDLETSSAFADADLAAFSEPFDLGVALSSVRRSDKAARDEPLAASPDQGKAPTATLRAFARGGVIDELESKRILRSAGAQTVDDREAHSAEEAVEAACALGYPVALKLVAPGLAHKAAVGGVVLDLRSAEEVRAAALRLFRRMDDLAIGSEGTGLLVEPMCRGIEMFLGVTHHPHFGSVAVCGRGGVDVERDRHVSFRALPCTLEDVREVLAEQQLLSAVRSPDAAERLVDHVYATLHALWRTWQFAPAVIRSIDANPVMVDERGTCTVVDALIELHEVVGAPGGGS